MDYELIDTHAHPQMSQYDDDRDAVLERARGSGIGIICVGVDLETSRKAVALSTDNPGVFASVGLHPNDNLEEEYDEQPYRDIVTARESRDSIIAIGEIGLDYFRTVADDLRRTQRVRFQKQLQLAQDVALPVILHCREAYDDMADVLRAFPGMKGVVHSFTGNAAQAEVFMEMGLHIGLNGIVTFSDSYVEMAASISGDRLLLETDSPFLAPVPYRGQRNEPFYIIETAKALARYRNTEFEHIKKVTTYNAISLFSIGHNIAL